MEDLTVLAKGCIGISNLNKNDDVHVYLKGFCKAYEKLRLANQILLELEPDSG